MSSSPENGRVEEELPDGTFCPTEFPVGRIGRMNPDYAKYVAYILAGFAAVGIPAALVSFG